MEMILGMGANEPRVPLERTEFVALGPEVLHPQPDRAGHPGGHHRPHLPRDQLDQRAQPGPPRDQRHRDDEPPGRGGHRRLVGAPGRGQVLDPRLRGGRDRPDLVPRGGRRAPARCGPGWSARSSRSRRWSGTSPRTTPTWSSRCSASPTCSAPTSSPPSATTCAGALLPSIAGFDPLVQFVEEDDVVRALEYVTGQQVPGVFNVAGAGKLPWSEVASICGAFLLPLPPFRPRAFVAPLRRLGTVQFPPELEGLVRYGRGVDTSRLRRGRLRVPVHQRRGGRELRPGQQPAAGHRVRRAAPTATSRTSSSSSATRRRWCGASTARSGPGPGGRWRSPRAVSSASTRRPATRAPGPATPRRSWRSGRGPPTARRSRESRGPRPRSGVRASRPPAGWPCCGE